MANHVGKNRHLGQFVLDASCLLKPFLGEEGLEKVKKIIGLNLTMELSLLAPDLLEYEFINNIFKRYDYDFAKVCIDEMKKMEISFLPLTDNMRKWAFEYWRKYPKLSYYDLSYHMMAKGIEGTFITADKAYYRIMAKEGDVVLLDDLKI